MEKMNLKVLFSIFIIFIMFFAPLIFEIYPDESAYAMGRGGGKRIAKLIAGRLEGLDAGKLINGTQMNADSHRSRRLYFHEFIITVLI